MFVWNLEKLLHVFDEVFFDSDHDGMLATAARLGAHPVQRPHSLLGHDIPSVPIFQHLTQTMPQRPEAVLYVQANSPTCRLSTIEKAAAIMRHTTCDELLAMNQDRSNNGAVWGLSYRRLMEYGDFYVKTPDVFIVDPCVDIHTEEDLQQAISDFQELAEARI